MGLLEGKRGLVVGIANERSIAYGIARRARAEGAELVVTYQSERLRRMVSPLAAELGAGEPLPCDLGDDSQLAAVVDGLRAHAPALDFVVHAVAFARAEDLAGRFLDTSAEGFRVAMDVSVYSLVRLVRAVEPLLVRGRDPAVLTLSYYGSEKAMPGYNVMGVAKAALEASVRYLAAELGPAGIRVNALSPGPVKTLSAAGIRGLRRMLAATERTAPLRRNVTLDEIGDAALPYLSHLGRGTTGEVVFVDAGYHVVGAPQEPDSA